MRRKRKHIPITIGKSIQVVDDIRYIKLRGMLFWKFLSHEHAPITLYCENWYMIVNNNWVLFWSPNCDWIPCVMIKEWKLKDYRWRLVSNQLHIDDPGGASLAILDDFEDYCLNNDTVPIIDNSFIEDSIYRLILAI